MGLGALDGNVDEDGLSLGVVDGVAVGLVVGGVSVAVKFFARKPDNPGFFSMTSFKRSKKLSGDGPFGSRDRSNGQVHEVSVLF